jgi:hypothetical protein
MGAAAEENLSRSLRSILGQISNNAPIEDSEQRREFLLGLEFFLPGVLREIHPEWRWESLDGVIPYVARKTGNLEAEFIGHYILITDQSHTPIHLRLQLAPDVDEVSWLELKLGEKGDNGQIQRPYPPTFKRVAAVKDRTDSIDWVYKVGFGQRRT